LTTSPQLVFSLSQGGCLAAPSSKLFDQKCSLATPKLSLAKLEFGVDLKKGMVVSW